MTIGQKIDAALTNAKSIVVMAHTAPDTDAICSCLVMVEWIKKLYGKSKVDIALDGKISERYKPLLGKTKTYPTWYKYDVAIALDCAEPKRLGKYEKMYTRSQIKINIDHHETNTLFGDIVKVEAEASSTCEVLYRMYKNRDVEMSDRIAKLIYAAIVTDTVCFSINNITQNTLKVASEIVKRNINTDEIKNYFFKNDSRAKVDLLQKALKSLKYYHNNKIAVMQVTHNDLIKTEATFEDTIGIVDSAINISCVDIAIAIIEKNPKQYYISMRSKNSNVAQVARDMGGGGHTNMAAFHHKGELRTIYQKLIKQCESICSDSDNNIDIFN